MDVVELSIDLPRRADCVLADVELGNLPRLGPLRGARADATPPGTYGERANAAMIAAACIVGITILMAVYLPQGWQAAIAWAFWIAIIIAGSIVVRTALATLRNRK